MKKKSQIAVLLVIIIAGLSISNFCLSRPNSSYKYQQFFEEKGDFDVLFFGSSHVMNGISPLDIWGEYGITSYNLGNSNSLLPQTYWTIVEATRYHKPKIIVLDTYFIHWDEKTQGTSWTHDAFDCFPLDITKYQLAKDLFEDRASITELLFPFSVYHNRWEEVDSKELHQKLSRSSNWNKGCELLYGKHKFNNLNLIPESEYEKYDSTGIDYLKKISMFCSDNGIQLVLIRIPFEMDDQLQLKLNYVSVIAKDMNLPFINYSYSDVVDFSTDFADDSHLNREGARKFSLALGRYLKDNYSLKDKRNDPNYDDWNNDYSEMLLLSTSEPGY
ncbi:hypothetical protein [Butyrivibrio fibrisolvens]|uniref:hypothetical protein n=1 Tax=Butyrivibrio fibrisolvens TaxID=831 RepID=UPI0003FDA46B|nr:hypothetical protein [Butyrivibrio fibrisolvens]